jgi:hypothetical protein
MINATMWTQVNLREKAIILQLSELLAKGIDDFIPTIIYGGKLTARKNKKYNKENEEDINLFSKCLNDNEVLRIVLTNSDRKKREVEFAFTIAFVPQFTVISFEVTHSFFKSQNEKARFIEIINRMIKITKPMFANIDDIGNSLNIMEDMGEDIYQLDKYVPAVFWGNYFGKHYADKIGREKILSFNGHRVEELKNGGIYIQISPQPLNPSSLSDRRAQRELAKLIGVKR